MSYCQTPIVVALDLPTYESALEVLDQLNPELCRIKIGKELFTSSGSRIIKSIKDRGFEIFLDLKFHDIPNTAAMAVSAASSLGVWMVSIHCSGGSRMIQACRDVLDKSSTPKKPLLMGVTVLTSMNKDDLKEIGISSKRKLEEQVLLLASFGYKSGLDGLISSPMEVKILKSKYPSLQLVTPGIRLSKILDDDQRRILTPREALHLGSNYLVIGRPITRSSNPGKVLKSIITSYS